jgi:hypothetical protein
MSARRPACRRCPHDRASHRHYRPGSDCGLCECRQYKPERPWTRVLAWMRRRTPPVPVDVLHAGPVPYPVPDSAGDDDDRTQFGIRVSPYVGEGSDGLRPFVPRQRGRHDGEGPA